MSKRLPFIAALAVFLTVSGMSTFVVHLTIINFQYSAVYASSNKFEGWENQSAWENPASPAMNNVRPLVAQASSAMLSTGSPKTLINRNDNAGVLQHDDASVNQEAIDLGEIFIDSAK